MSWAGKTYWQKNVTIMACLLGVWAFVSYGCGIIFAVPLNSIHFMGFPLGFWFAQQGAIYVFVALIFIYVKLMERLDKEHDVDE